MIESLRGTEVVDVAAGGAHSACVTAAGDLYTWGKGRYGRLGHSDSEDQLKPKLVRSSFAWEVWRDSLPLSLSFFKNKNISCSRFILVSELTVLFLVGIKTILVYFP